MKDTAPALDLDLGPLGRSLGFLLRLAQLKDFARYHDEIGPEGPSPGAYTVLDVIGRNPGIRQGALARALWIKRAHMTKLVRGFDAAGLVTRAVPADDRRAVALSLTEAGRAVVARHAPTVHAHGTTPPAELTADEHAALVWLLRKHLALEEAP